ncbi:MAG TPA: hypothetical protein ENI60_06780, partial [Candidatus Fraserbacteria bacterium]|nr:hypothetical protein [Candidatus Fraserbacteria bacterium]
MKHDFFTAYVDQWQGQDTLDRFAQVQLLAEALVSEKVKAQNLLKEWVLQGRLDEYFQRQQKSCLEPL